MSGGVPPLPYTPSCSAICFQYYFTVTTLTVHVFLMLFNFFWGGGCRHESGDRIEIELSSFAVGGMSRPPKPVPQVKKVAPPAVPDVFRHSGSSFGSAGYSSSEDGCFITGSEGQPPRGKRLGHLEIKPFAWALSLRCD